MLLYFKSYEDLEQATDILNTNNIAIKEQYFPHDIESTHHNSVRFKYSILAICIGIVAFTLMFGFQLWVMNVGFDLNYGGTPNNFIPAFIPVAFEVMTLSIVLTLLFVFIFSYKGTKHAKHTLYILEIQLNTKSREIIESLLQNSNIKVFEIQN
ncbi:MAG: quinol:electron acceptor oxidoreductase subunit ActD [Bacteroidales bacterium]